MLSFPSPDENTIAEPSKGIEIERSRGRPGRGQRDAEVSRDTRTGLRSRTDDQVRFGIDIEVLHGEPDATAAVGVATEEIREVHVFVAQEARAVEDEDARPAAGAAAGDEIGDAVPVQISGRHEDAVSQRLLECEEVIENLSPDTRERRSIISRNARPASETSDDDKIAPSVAGDVGDARTPPRGNSRRRCRRN